MYKDGFTQDGAGNYLIALVITISLFLIGYIGYKIWFFKGRKK